MNKLHHFTLPALFTLFAWGACSDADVYNPEAVRPNYPLGKDIVAPEGFDWKMTSEVQLSVDVTDLYDARYDYLIEVFPQDPTGNPDLLPMAAGYANTGKTYKTTIVLPDTYTTVYLRQTAPDGSQTVAACALNGTETHYKFDTARTKAEIGELRTASYPIEIQSNVCPYTFCFEDQWPNYGDYDMNDVVLTIHTIKGNNVNGDGYLKDYKLEAHLQAVGASKHIGLGIRFKGLRNDVHLDEFNIEAEDRKFETSCEDATVIIFDDVHRAIDKSCTGYPFINTSMDEDGITSSYRNINIKLHFADNEEISPETFNINNIDFFLIIGTDSEGKRIEVHVPGYAPTENGSTVLFGQGDDNSSSVGNKHYLSKDNLCWAFVVPGEFKWPTERTQITSVYSGFAGWVTSGGANNSGWWNKADGDFYEK